ncbi:colicin immunity protein Cui, partial [Salmonella enterica subsp. enterica serovar Agona]|nr:colicin immunity protein Cui [Salmonella enterica subsp. enterica serovar Agona]
ICINVKKRSVFVFFLYNTIYWDIYIHIFVLLVPYRNI